MQWIVDGLINCQPGVYGGIKMEYTTFDYPVHPNLRKQRMILLIIIAITGIPLALLYQNIFPLFSSSIIGALIFIGLWYADDHNVPTKTGLGDDGVDLFFANGKKIFIPWIQLNSYGLSSSPKTNVAPAIIFYSGRKYKRINYDAAVEIARRYELITNRPLREVWLSKDLKNRFRNL
jgi:hypothetical protein